MDKLEKWVGRPRPPHRAGNWNVLNTNTMRTMCVCWMDEENARWFLEYYTNRYGDHYIFTERKS